MDNNLLDDITSYLQYGGLSSTKIGDYDVILVNNDGESKGYVIKNNDTNTTNKTN